MSVSNLTDEQVRRIDAWWRAANDLSVGQIHLLDNPLLRIPLKLEGYLQPPSEHPHGLPDADFDSLFTTDMLVEHHQYICEHGDDLPAVRDWVWPSA